MLKQPQVASHGHRGVTGQQVVIGMFAFGVLMVAALWLYWELYTRPYRALQNAIAARYEGSSPRVIGGRPRSHETGSPNVLRIIVRVAFDPVSDTQQSEETANELIELAAAHHDMTPYDAVEVHLEQRVAEQATRHWMRSQPAAGGPMNQ